MLDVNPCSICYLLDVAMWEVSMLPVSTATSPPPITSQPSPSPDPCLLCGHPLLAVAVRPRESRAYPHAPRHTCCTDVLRVAVEYGQRQYFAARRPSHCSKSASPNGRPPPRHPQVEEGHLAILLPRRYFISFSFVTYLHSSHLPPRHRYFPIILGYKNAPTLHRPSSSILVLCLSSSTAILSYKFGFTQRFPSWR
jgi:hypothetical protein